MDSAPVSSDCYSVQEFRDVIERASHDVSFIWLDVVCIDQENRVVKILEIGRQAAILNGAKTTYIWLRSLDAAMLQGQANELSTAASRLEEDLIDSSSLVSDEEMSDVSHFYLHDSFDATYEPECLYDEVWTSTVKRVLQNFKLDPWFTSLWTLQEMYLAPTAVLLSRDAYLARRKGGGHEISLGNLIIWQTRSTTLLLGFPGAIDTLKK
jgi:hypothetical protein